jgi:hypothetical protein
VRMSNGEERELHLGKNILFNQELVETQDIPDMN